MGCWHPLFDPLHEWVTKHHLWVLLPSLPFPFWNLNTLEGIANTIDRKKVIVVKRSLTILGSTFGVYSISEEVAGFSPFMVSPRKNIVFIVSCV